MTNLLEMTHEQLLIADAQTKLDYRNQLKNHFCTRVKNYFDFGFKHVQIGFHSCIKLKSNKNGLYYVTRNGKGFGNDTGEFLDLKDATDSLLDCGHYNLKYTTITAK
jgi:hypothetical protein